MLESGTLEASDHALSTGAVWQPSASATARVSPPTLDISRRRTTTRGSAARLGSADRSDSGSCSAQAPGGTAHARRTRDGSRTNLARCSGGGCGCRSSLRGNRDPYRMSSQRCSNALSPGCRSCSVEQSRSETQANSSAHRPVWGSQPIPAGQVPPGPQRKPSSAGPQYGKSEMRRFCLHTVPFGQTLSSESIWHSARHRPTCAQRVCSGQSWSRSQVSTQTPLWVEQTAPSWQSAEEAQP